MLLSESYVVGDLITIVRRVTHHDLKVHLPWCDGACLMGIKTLNIFGPGCLAESVRIPWLIVTLWMQCLLPLWWDLGPYQYFQFVAAPRYGWHFNEKSAEGCTVFDRQARVFRATSGLPGLFFEFENSAAAALTAYNYVTPTAINPSTRKCNLILFVSILDLCNNEELTKPWSVLSWI
jgi:hypothetical protein